MPIAGDYAERVYAGVLGKIIGVYLGRPFEGWDHEKMISQLGEIYYYVDDRQDLPLENKALVVTDDDISGTFTFLRALPDYGNSLNLTPAQVGQTWLNYIIEQRTILWWGLGQLHRTHRLSEIEGRRLGTGERLHRPEQQDRRRADRGPDLYRRLGYGSAWRPRAGRRPRPSRSQRQPRWRSRLWSPGRGGHGGRCLRRAQHRQAHRRCGIPHSQRLRDLSHDRRHPGVAREREGLAQDPRVHRG